MFDITQLASTDTADLHIRDQSDEPLYAIGEDGKQDLTKPMTITLYGPGSRVWKQAEHKMSQSNQAKSYAAMRGKADKDSVDDSHARIVERWAACTVSLNNFDHPGGVVGLYGQFNLGFILDQVFKFSSDWANFPKVSTTS